MGLNSTLPARTFYYSSNPPLNGVFYIVRGDERPKQRDRGDKQAAADFHTVVRLRPYLAYPI